MLPTETLVVLTLQPVNADVQRVHLDGGAHVGNLKRVGGIWKFKAIGYDSDGSVIPGGGPFTDRHNTTLAEPDAQVLGAALGAALSAAPTTERRQAPAPKPSA